MFRIFTFGLLTGLALDLYNAQQIPKTDFSCEGRASGYYADVSSGCQLYHMCDGLGRQFSYTCPNATLFQQRMLICDHWYMVNCSRSEDDYSANLLIGQKKPFVDDTVNNPYYRTPRPDLLSHPSSEAEYNIIYRTGKDYKASKNIVGIEPESQQSTYADEPTYFPPSHWSTEYPSHVTTVRPSRGNQNNRRNQNNNIKTNYPPKTSNQNYDNTNFPSRTVNKNYDKTNYSTAKGAGSSTKTKQPKAININSSNRNENTVAESPKYKVNSFKYNASPTEVPVNFKSNFRATTPVFPTVVKERLVPTEAPLNNRQNFRVTRPPVIPSVVPPSVDISTSTEVPVNYKSNFKATTPVFPLTVEDTSVAPNEIGILPPIPYRGSETDNKDSESAFKVPEPEVKAEDKAEQPHVNFKSDFKATTPVYPSSVELKNQQSSNAAQNTEVKTEQPQVNFKSDFKATTPVYPTFVDLKNRKSSGAVEEKEESQVNFKSDFKATTPVYPSADELKKLNVETDYSSFLENPPKRDDTPVIFVSNFKATTPVYPTSVEPTSPDPGEIGLLPPQSNDTTSQDNQTIAEVPKSDSGPALSLSIEPPKFDERYKDDPDHLQTTAQPPSMFYEPPKDDPDYTSTNSKVVAKPGIEIENLMKSLTREQWQNLRSRFHIPEYDFPLDDATRPSYESGLNSFAVKAADKR